MGSAVAGGIEMTQSHIFLQVHAILLARYRHIIQEAREDGVDPFASDPRLSLENLAWMVEEIFRNMEDWPADKTGRWTGFVQGCLAMRRLIDVDRERDITRPLFHSVYRSDGQATPESSARC